MVKWQKFNTNRHVPHVSGPFLLGTPERRGTCRRRRRRATRWSPQTDDGRSHYTTPSYPFMLLKPITAKEESMLVKYQQLLLNVTFSRKIWKNKKEMLVEVFHLLIRSIRPTFVKWKHETVMVVMSSGTDPSRLCLQVLRVTAAALGFISKCCPQALVRARFLRAPRGYLD